VSVGAMLTRSAAIEALIWIVIVAVALTFIFTRGVPFLWRKLRGTPPSRGTGSEPPGDSENREKTL